MLETQRMDGAAFNCRPHGAPRFGFMFAIAKTALAQMRAKFDEAFLQRRFVQMCKSESLHAGAVDEPAVFQGIHAREGGGVLARVERGRYFGGGGCG